MKDGKPSYTYNFLGLARYTIVAPQALASSPATVTLDLAYDGGVGKGGKATLSVNGKSVIDNQTPVAEGIGIGPEARFTSKINKITLEVSTVK
jgi:arylsulfatase